jgi:hypothetical protein
MCACCDGLMRVPRSNPDARECIHCGSVVSIADAEVPVYNMATARLELAPMGETVAPDWLPLRYRRNRAGEWHIERDSQWRLFNA